MESLEKIFEENKEMKTAISGSKNITMFVIIASFALGGGLISFLFLYLTGSIDNRGGEQIIPYLLLIWGSIGYYIWNSRIKDWLTTVKQDEIIIRGKIIKKEEIEKVIIRMGYRKGRYGSKIIDYIKATVVKKNGEKEKISIHAIEELAKYNYPVELEVNDPFSKEN